jgi:nitrate/nitrite transporter NarK
VLAAADARHAGIASGINNAVARVGSLLAVALLPLIAGLTGESFYDPASMTDGFRIAMIGCAVLAAAGGVIAWLMISSEVLHAEPEPGGVEPTQVLREVSCGAPGPLLRPGREAECEPVVVERVKAPAA